MRTLTVDSAGQVPDSSQKYRQLALSISISSGLAPVPPPHPAPALGFDQLLRLPPKHLYAPRTCPIQRIRIPWHIARDDRYIVVQGQRLGDRQSEDACSISACATTNKPRNHSPAPTMVTRGISACSVYIPTLCTITSLYIPSRTNHPGQQHS